MLPERRVAPSRWTALRGAKEASSVMLWIVMLSCYHPSLSSSTESKRPRAVEPPTYLIRVGAPNPVRQENRSAFGAKDVKIGIQSRGFANRQPGPFVLIRCLSARDSLTWSRPHFAIKVPFTIEMRASLGSYSTSPIGFNSLLVLARFSAASVRRRVQTTRAVVTTGGVG